MAQVYTCIVCTFEDVCLCMVISRKEKKDFYPTEIGEIVPRFFDTSTNNASTWKT
jgi:hypothetical protein